MKKTSNKGFSMVELIIVIAIMAILAAALAPALIKYINKSRLSTDVQTGQTIATSIQSALADESANNAASSISTMNVNALLSPSSSNSFSEEFKAIMGVTSVTGKSAKDANGSSFDDHNFYVSMNPASNAIKVWYGSTSGPSYDNWLVSPDPGVGMVKK
ncbi:MAG: prepilin-type N-terminal cleavage/methylation domain-containing protein [Clostridium sp.]|nr:prepilin-type N-terminal cleavage/methylation domain-containing protein [Clostridium sp.]